MVWCFFPWSRMICWLVECSQTEVFSQILWKLILQILRFWKNSEKSWVDNMTCFSHRRPWLRFQRFHGGVGLGIQGQSHWMVSLYMREIGRGTLQTWLMIIIIVVIIVIIYYFWYPLSWPKKNGAWQWSFNGRGQGHRCPTRAAGRSCGNNDVPRRRPSETLKPSSTVCLAGLKPPPPPNGI